MLALGSDSPTAPFAPLSNLYCATTRRSAREPESRARTNEHYALPVAIVMAAATEGAAYSCFADALTGKLRPGLKADFAVVDVIWTLEGLLKVRCTRLGSKGRRSMIAMMKDITKFGTRIGSNLIQHQVV